MKHLSFGVVFFTVAALGVPAHADDVTPPPVPSNLQVPAGNRAFREGHAAGTQDYLCLPSGTGFAWTFFGPQATLLDDDDKLISRSSRTSSAPIRTRGETSETPRLLHNQARSSPGSPAAPWVPQTPAPGVHLQSKLRGREGSP
jgi:hypothetical protein